MVEKNIVQLQHFENKRRHLERENHLHAISTSLPIDYHTDIRGYQKYCAMTDQEEGKDSLLDYLYVSVVDLRIKRRTWLKRNVALKRYLNTKMSVVFDDEFKSRLKTIQKIYEQEKFAELIHGEGKSPVDKPELLKRLQQLDVRERAICLVNLITANRPSEMVRLQIKDFNLEANYVRVYLKKQRKWHIKRLNQDTVMAIRQYIRTYKLTPENYLVGHVMKSGYYKSRQISDTAYRKSLHKWIGLTSYNLRKTQVAAMHMAGADLVTIAKQTGHKSLKTLDEHYLKVSDNTVDKYL